MEIKKETMTTILVSMGIGTVLGVIADRYWQFKHTPEETLKKLAMAKDELIREQKELDRKIHQSWDASAEVAAERRKLEGRKQEYQNEVKPEIEARLRKELQDYISNADKVYTKAEKLKADAEHEREIADLKLDLAKTLNESVTHTEKETKIIVKSGEEVEEDDE